eukprot:SM000246S08212  [mRNA]  locus=s246:106936:111694:- [translate_table: standard]
MPTPQARAAGAGELTAPGGGQGPPRVGESLQEPPPLGESRGGSDGDDDGGGERPPCSSWVQCDECGKWRRVPSEVGEGLAGDSKWFCRDNVAQDFASCATPQEKSNHAINVELGMSDSEGENPLSRGDAPDSRAGSARRSELAQTTTGERSAQEWTLIYENKFVSRRRRMQHADELACLTLLALIATLCAFFPLQAMFHAKKYVKMRCSRFGKKGFGLQVLEPIQKGMFLIEYVGEVTSRKLFWPLPCCIGQVIDAYRKGNISRFLNHSCSPNCEVQKWNVGGEVCIGVFAVVDIAANEELTFDYNFELLGGAHAKKCYCGTVACRGFIGRDATRPTIAESCSSDDSAPEPLMLEETDSAGLPEESSKLETSSVGEKYQLEGFLNLHVSVLLSGLLVVELVLEGVLDECGGIYKKKATEFLKVFVLLTATSNLRAASSRDLSLLLDALLKTHSANCLTKIVIGLNGIRSLQTLARRLPKAWEKTPVLRKLLRVFEHLGKLQVLTKDLVNRAPAANAAMGRLLLLTVHQQAHGWLLKDMSLTESECAEDVPSFLQPVDPDIIITF